MPELVKVHMEVTYYMRVKVSEAIRSGLAKERDMQLGAHVALQCKSGVSNGGCVYASSWRNAS